MSSSQFQSGSSQQYSQSDKNKFESDLEKILNQFDTNKSGYIEKNQANEVFQRISNQMGLKQMDSNQINQVVNQLDKNNTGRIEKNSLKDYLWNQCRQQSSSC